MALLRIILLNYTIANYSRLLQTIADYCKTQTKKWTTSLPQSKFKIY
jgi:hypothetical protein